MERRNETKGAVEVRCPKGQCRCSPHGKLLATLIDPPPGLAGSGAVIQLACPIKKSRLIQVRL